MSNAVNRQNTVTSPKKYSGSLLSVLTVILPILLSVMIFADSAYAGAGAAGTAPMAYCAKLSATMLKLPNPQPTGAIVHCFTDYPDGLIPYATNYLLTNATITKYFSAAVGAIVVFIVTTFGIKVITGDAQKLKSEAFVILFKIGGVGYFLSNASNIYGQLLKVVAGLNNVMASAAASATGGLFCTRTDIWASFDCLYAYLTGAAFTSGIIVIIVILALIAFVSMGMGIIVLFAFLYLMVYLFGMLTRFMQVYLLAVMSLSFIFLVGYLFVPMLFFKNTFHFFQKWLAIVFAYVLLPVILYGYMGFVFVGLDKSLISGPTSIMNEFLGGGCSAAMDTCPQLTQFHCPKSGEANGRLCNTHHITLFYLGPEDSPNKPFETNTGTVGILGDNGISGLDYNSTFHSGRYDIGFDIPGADLSELAFEQGKQKTFEQYMFDLIISIMVACILIYILHSLFTYVFDLAAELVSQGTSAGRGVVKAEVFGESLVRHTLDLAKQAALAYATGGTSVAAQGAAQAAAKQAAQHMASNRNKNNSDLRLKENIVFVRFQKDIPIYHFSYKNDPMKKVYEGVMAQDLLYSHPDAVITGEDGYYKVDYDKIGIEFKQLPKDNPLMNLLSSVQLSKKLQRLKAIYKNGFIQERASYEI